MSLRFANIISKIHWLWFLLRSIRCPINDKKLQNYVLNLKTMTVCEKITFFSYPVHSHKSIQFLQIVDVHYMKIFRNNKSVIVKPSIKQMIPQIRLVFLLLIDFLKDPQLKMRLHSLTCRSILYAFSYS